MATKKDQQPTATTNPEKDPRDWVTGNEPATGPQESYVHTLAQQAGEEVEEGMSKAEASEKIEELQAKTGRGARRSKSKAGK